MFALDELQYYPVNWVDGMRIAAKDFAATDDAWQDALRDVRASIFQGVQYGLLPALRDRRETSNYPKFRYEQSKSLLTLLECRAITEGGYRIEITENLHREFKVPAVLPSAKIQNVEDFEVYITVEMFEKQAAGKQAESAPPRRLLVAPLYELSVLPKGVGLSGMNHLKIAEFRTSRQGLVQDEGFIPPCLTLSAHQKLRERYDNAGSLLKLLYDNGLKLVCQYRADARPSVRDATAWVEKWVLFIGGNLWTYNEVLPNQSPAQTLIYFKNLAQFTLTALDMHETNDFLKEAAASQRSLLKAIADPNFNEDNLKAAFDGIDEFLNGLLRWREALAESFKQGRVIRVDEIKNWR